MTKFIRKTIYVFLIAALMIGGNSLCAYAKNITKVKLEFSGTTPTEGEEPGSISCSAGTGYYVSSCKYTNDFEFWMSGDIPIVKVELTTDSNYKFTKATSGYFTITGMGARFSTAELLSDTSLSVTVTLKRVTNDDLYDLEAPDNLRWDGDKAAWDPVADATSYDVEIFCDDTSMGSLNIVSRTSTSVKKYVTKDGEYKFRVRSSRGSKKGEWSSFSETNTYTGVSNSSGSGSSSSGSGSSGGPGSSSKKDSGSSASGSSSGDAASKKAPGTPTAAGWNKSPNGWWYMKADKTFPYNCWLEIDGKWYLFDDKGYMLTGWVLRDNLYYCLASDGALYVNCTTPDGYRVNSDGVRIYSTANDKNVSGSIPTGKIYVSEGWRYYNADGSYVKDAWKLINNKWYHFDKQGYSKIGWYLEDGIYYYFGEDGAMLTNTETPDGHYVDADGVMIR